MRRRLWNGVMGGIGLVLGLLLVLGHLPDLAAQNFIPTVESNVDPCQVSGTAKSSVALNITSSAQIVAASGSSTIYVCGWAATVGGTTPTYQMQSGTGAVCATGTVNRTGTVAPTVGAFNVYAPGMTAFATAASEALCIATGGTAPSVQGILTYVQQ